jgi:hypothetical protein
MQGIMRKRKRFLLILLLLAAAGVWLGSSLLTTTAQAQQPEAVQQYGLTWDVVASGGATMSSDSYTMLSTTGQPLAGPASNDTHTLHSGYWQKVVDEVVDEVRQILLPLLTAD